MPFPTDPLAVELGIAWGADLDADPATWPFIDYTSRWLTSDDVTISGGRSEGAVNGESRRLELTLKNPDGQLTPEDARSPLWPHVVDGTPIYWRQDAGNGQVELFAGFIISIVPEWPDDSAGKAVAKVSARGQLYRLDQGTPPVLSALYRAYAVASPAPIAWYPLEDGSNVDAAASGIPGQPPMTELGRTKTRYTTLGTPDGAVVWGVQGSGGAGSLVGLAEGGRLTAPIPRTSTDEWTFEFVVRYPAKSELAAGSVPMTITAGGGYEWSFLFQPSGFPNQMAGGLGGSASVVVEWTDDMWDGLLHHVRLVVDQQGADAAHYVYVDGVSVGSAFWFAAAPPVPDQFQPNAYWDTGSREAAIGHLALFGFADHWDTARPDAAQAWVDENASDRIVRLCAEAGVPVTVAPGGDPKPMGAQQPGTLATLLREAEAAGGGRLSESGWGLHYLPLAALYNQAPTLVVDAANRELHGDFQPRLDTQRYRNKWTVSRPGGSSATASRPDPRRGVWADSATVNVASDAQLPDHAEWRTHLTTWPGMRYPALQVSLHDSPQLVAAVEALGDGSRIQVVHPPRQHSPEPIDQLVDGWRHTIRGRRWWRVQTTSSPAGPYDIATADGDQRACADGSTLGATLALGAMSLSLSSTTENGPWRTTADDATVFPLPVRVGGEKITVSAIAGAGNVSEDFEDAALTVTITGTWARASGTAHAGTWSLKSATISHGAQTNAVVTVPAGATSMTYWYLVSSEPTFDWFRVLLDGVQVFQDSGAGVWTERTVDVTGVSQVTFRYIKDSSTVAGSDAAWIDDLSFIVPQTATISARGVNGVTRSWPAGTEVDVWSPAIAPL